MFHIIQVIYSYIVILALAADKKDAGVFASSENVGLKREHVYIIIAAVIGASLIIICLILAFLVCHVFSKASSKHRLLVTLFMPGSFPHNYFVVFFCLMKSLKYSKVYNAFGAHKRLQTLFIQLDGQPVPTSNNSINQTGPATLVWWPGSQQWYFPQIFELRLTFTLVLFYLRVTMLFAVCRLTMP